jgi:hypothetical protein
VIADASGGVFGAGTGHNFVGVEYLHYRLNAININGMTVNAPPELRFRFRRCPRRELRA